MIARIWTGATRDEDADAYEETCARWPCPAIRTFPATARC